MWLYEEEYNGRKLTEVINETHYNPRYLPVRSIVSRMYETLNYSFDSYYCSDNVYSNDILRRVDVFHFSCPKSLICPKLSQITELSQMTELSHHVSLSVFQGHELPSNLIATPDLPSATREADLIVVVLPHQFVARTCEQMKDYVKSSAHAISLVKGLVVKDGRPQLFSSIVSTTLGIPCSVLSGANVANDIARENFSESTLGYDDADRDAAVVWQQLDAALDAANNNNNSVVVTAPEPAQYCSKNS